jgi:hypothetical protein
LSRGAGQELEKAICVAALAADTSHGFSEWSKTWAAELAVTTAKILTSAAGKSSLPT